MDSLIVQEKLESLRRCIDIGTHIISHAESQSPGSISEVFDVLADLGRISESTDVAMRKAVGSRNMAVHNYGELNWEIVQTISHDRLKNFQLFAREIAKNLE